MDIGSGYLGSLIVTLGADTSGLLLAQKAVDKTAASMTRSMSVLGRDMQMAGRNMTFGLTMPLLYLQKTAITVFAEFENNLTKINGLVGVSKVLTQQWAAQIKSMAVEVAKTPVELSDALYFITSAGITGAESMTILRESAKAATAGLGDTKTVADLVTSTINAFGRSNITAREAVEALVATVREGKAEPEDLAKSMGVVLPVAALMGMKFEEVGASIAAMTRTGLKAGTSAIYLRQTLNTLLKPSKMTADGLAMIGTSAAKVREDIEQHGFLQALKKIKEATDDNVEVLGKIFPNLRAYTGVVSILGKNLKDTTEIFNSLTDNTGDLGKAFDVAHNTMFSFKQIAAGLQTSMITLGEMFARALLPIFKSLASTAMSITDAFKNMSKSTQTLIASFVAFLTVGGPVVWMLGSMFQATVALGPVFNYLKIALVNTIAVIRTMTATMMANPYMALGAALIALVLIVNKAIKAFSQLSEEQQKIRDINVAANKEIVSQKVAFMQLTSIASNVNASYAQRQEAMKRINDLLPEHLKGLNLESIAYGKAQTAIKQYLDELKREAALRALQADLEKIEADRIEQLSNPKTLGQAWNPANSALNLLNLRFKEIGESWKFLGYTIVGESEKYLNEVDVKEREAYDRKIALNLKMQNELLGMADSFAKNYGNKMANAFKLDLLGQNTSDLGKGTFAPLLPNSSRAALENAGKQQSVIQQTIKNYASGFDSAAKVIMDEYVAALNVLDDKYKVMQDAQDYYTNKLKIQDTAISELILKLGTEDEQVLKLKNDYLATKKALEAYTEATKKLKEENATDVYEKWQKDIKDLDTIYNIWGNTQEYLQSKLKSTEAAINKLATSEGDNSERIAQLKEVWSAASISLDTYNKTVKAYPQDALIALFTYTADYQKELKKLDKEYEAWGDQQNYVEGKLKIQKELINLLIPLFGAKSEGIQKLIADYDALAVILDTLNSSSKVMTFEEIQNALKKGLEDNVKLSTLLGSSYGETEKAIDLYTEAMQRMLAIKPEEWTNEMIMSAQNWNATLIRLREETASFTSVVREMGSVFSNLGSLMDELFPEENGFTRFLKTIGKGISVVSSFMRVTESIGKVMKFIGKATDVATTATTANTIATAANVAVTEVKTIATDANAASTGLNTVLTNTDTVSTGANTASIGANTVAVSTNTAANAANAAAKIYSTMGWIPIVGVALASAAVGFMIGSMTKAKKAASVGMSEGGMVPEGYPNDTFYARLSSRETVIPLDRLPELGGGQNFHFEMEPLVIKGTDIHYIVKEVDRKYNKLYKYKK